MRQIALGIVVLALAAFSAGGQSINSGTVLGTVVDQSKSAIAGAQVHLRNAVTGYEQSAITDNTGSFRFNNVPQKNYRLTATAAGFASSAQEVDVRSALPLTANLQLNVAAAST